MRPNPIDDAVHFLAGSALYYVFAILVVLSLIIAIVNLARDPGQRSPKNLVTYILRFFIGCMWWQQTLWKLPPTYTDLPDGSGGLRYWVGKMIDGAAFQIHSDFVQYVVLPNFLLFAPVVYAIEVFIGVSLLLGAAVRLSGLVGAAMATNLWLGLYSTHGEWPWTYFFLIVVQLMFAINQAGRSLGIDAMIARRVSDDYGAAGLRARILDLVT
jgi:uncharacterized membrane protein YphA (DoxX/SURF4 family)